MMDTDIQASLAQAPVRLGMVGGGRGAFIGAVHRWAAGLDSHYRLVAGAFSSDPENARASAAECGVAADRAYASYEEMAKAEAARPDGIEAVAIVTPNHLHVPVALAFLRAGIHVICEKPVALDLAEAQDLAREVARSGRIFALTHNYTGYPMLRQAKAMVAAGKLGKIRVIQAEYVQDWMTEDTHSKQADWRIDPARAGAGGALGDIATHAYNALSFVTGLKLETVLADLTAFVPGRQLDDNDHLLLRFEGGAKGMLWATQVAPGNENALSLRVFGETGGLEWRQENPNYLRYTPFGEPTRILTRGGAGTGPEAQRVTRTPAGHPEGYLEGFANIYVDVAQAIAAARLGVGYRDAAYPTIEDGVDGMRFIEAAVRSSRDGGVWTRLDG
jgi:predicted dehydrogenase